MSYYQIFNLMVMVATFVMAIVLVVLVNRNVRELRTLRDENQRLRELASVCYVGLGGECNLPEHWLDALLAASEGKPFVTDTLLPFTLQPELDVRDTDRIQFLEAATKASRTGISLDFSKYAEGGQVLEFGYRFSRFRELGERKRTVREAIDAAMLAGKAE